MQNGEKDSWHIPRFLCAHAVMLSLEGIPAIYLHSFLASRNDLKRVENTGHYRAINRRKLDHEKISDQLHDPDSDSFEVMNGLKHLLAIRTKQPAFHPNATQFTLHFQPQVFGVWRQSIDRKQSIFALNNISNVPQSLSLAEINLVEIDRWHDLISGEKYEDRQQQITLSPYQTVWISNQNVVDMDT